MTSSFSQRGNVFFYILLGIVLFAALGFAISRNHIKSDMVRDEKAKLIATEIINYGSQVRDAVTKLKLRGCKDTQLDFSNSVYKKTNGSSNSMPTNSMSPADDSCDIYSASGANLTPYIVPSIAITGTNGTAFGSQSGHAGIFVYQVSKVGTEGATGTVSANDLVFYFSYLNKTVCDKINSLLNFPSMPSVGFIGSPSGYTNGSFSSTGYATWPNPSGQRAICYDIGSGYYFFVQILLDR